MRINARYLLHSIVEHFYLNRSFAIAQDDVIRHSEVQSTEESIVEYFCLNRSFAIAQDDEFRHSEVQST